MVIEVTPQEALLWLAGLEQPGHVTCNGQYPRGCCSCPGCGGTKSAPVLDLREPCPRDPRLSHNMIGAPDIVPSTELRCCQGRRWVPKQGVEALYQAMHDAGWWINCYWDATEKQRIFDFYCSGGNPFPDIRTGSDANAHIAAYKAMKQAGY